MNTKHTQKALLVAIFAALGLNGCSSGGGSGGDDTYAASGTAIDGLLQGAEACIDANSNFICDVGEATTTTNNDGTYSFSALTERPSGQILVIALSSVTGNETGKTLYLTAPIPESGDLSNLVVSPFTTLLTSGDLTAAELRTQLGLPADYDFNSVYEDGSLADDLAAVIAQKIADEIASNSTATISAADVLSNATNPLITIIDTIKGQATSVSPEELESLLAATQTDITVDYVADVVMTVTLSNSAQDPITEASISIQAKDSASGEVISSESGDALVLGETNSDGQALIALPQYDSPVIDLTVTIAKDGFVTQEKVFSDVTNGDALETSFTMLEEEVATFAVEGDNLDLGSAQAASLKTGAPAITIALVKNAQGERRILGGDAAAQAMADEDTEIEVGVQIPTARIDTDKVKAITAGIRGFNPMDDTDVQSFPGEFEGVGEPESVGLGVNTDRLNGGDAQAAAEEGTYQLISASFAQIRLTDQNGDEISLVDDAATAAADDNPVVYLRVSADSFSTIREDMDGDATGVQVPIYLYRSGQGWVLVGLGTLVEYNYSTNQYETFTGAVDSDDGISSNGRVYVEVTITEGNEWMRWINLDYPVKAGDLTTFTFLGNAQYEANRNGNSEDYTGSGRIYFENGAQEYIRFSGGSFNYTTLLGAGTQPEEAMLNIWNPLIGTDEEFAFEDDNDPATDNTFVVSPNPAVLQNPNQCLVQGMVYKADNTPSSWDYLQINDSTRSFYQSTATDGEGNFSVEIPCDKDLTIKRWYSTEVIAFNANGTHAATESADDANSGVVTLNDIVVPNQAPTLSYSIPWRISVTEDAPTEFNVVTYARDADSDSIVTDIQCPSAAAANVNVTTSKTCSISAADITDPSGSQYFSVTMTATDDAGATTTRQASVLAERTDINHPPRITSIRKNGYSLSCSTNNGTLTCQDRLRESDSADYTVIAYDPDGNPITLTSQQVTLNGNAFSASVANQPITVTATDAPTEEGLEAISVNAVLNIATVANQAPSMSLYISPYRIVPAYENGTLTLTVYPRDDFTDTDALLASAEFALQTADGTPVEAIFSQGQSAQQWVLDGSGLALGSYRILVTITDSDGVSSTSRATFDVGASNPPVIDSFSVSPTVINIDDLGTQSANELNLTASIRDDFADSEQPLAVWVEISNADEKVFYEADLAQGSGNDFSGTVDVSGIDEGDYIVTLFAKDADNDAVSTSKPLTVTKKTSDVTITIQ